jgi:hypothetical protein
MANFGSLGDIRHGEAIYAALHKAADYLRHAVPVSVCFDHCEVAHVFGQGGLDTL